MSFNRSRNGNAQQDLTIFQCPIDSIQYSADNPPVIVLGSGRIMGRQAASKLVSINNKGNSSNQLLFSSDLLKMAETFNQKIKPALEAAQKQIAEQEREIARLRKAIDEKNGITEKPSHVVVTDLDDPMTVALKKAIESNQWSSLNDFTTPNNINHPDESGMTILHKAIKLATSRIVCGLVRLGANVEFKTGYTQLSPYELATNLPQSTEKTKILSLIADQVKILEEARQVSMSTPCAPTGRAVWYRGGYC